MTTEFVNDMYSLQNSKISGKCHVKESQNLNVLPHGKYAPESLWNIFSHKFKIEGNGEIK